MRGPGADSVPAARLDEVTAPPAEFGIVGYTHGGGVDRPLVVWKGATVVVPHTNWRGVFGKGTNSSGGTSPVAIEWPGFISTAYHAIMTNPTPTTNWMGSLIGGHRDPDGHMYMRNRYYDPVTGQFTQTDPIGLGGGVNTYGFANGDPVGNWDPFGLCSWGLGIDAALGRCGSFLGPKEESSESQRSAHPEATPSSSNVCTDVPKAPAGVSVDDNVWTALRHRVDPVRQYWFYTMVRNGGPWDYKQRGRAFEAFGNVDYGATGSAVGFSGEILLRAAGAAQVRAGTSQPEFGTPDGDPPYGDDPADQANIQNGMDYHDRGCHLVPRHLRRFVNRGYPNWRTLPYLTGASMIDNICRAAISFVAVATVVNCVPSLDAAPGETILRVPSPDSIVEAVVTRSSIDATTPSVLRVFIVPMGSTESLAAGSERFRADHVTALCIVWRQPGRLELGYHEARIYHFSNFWSTAAADDFRYIVELRLAAATPSSALANTGHRSGAQSCDNEVNS